MATSAPLDWLLTWEAANSGAFGDSSQDVMDRIQKDNPDFDAQVKAGSIVLHSGATTEGFNESGNFTKPAYEPGSGVQWNKLPQIAGGIKLPPNTLWQSIGGRAGSDATPGAITIQDPNYGTLQLAQRRAPDDWQMQLARAASFSGVGALASIAIAPFLAGALGFEASASVGGGLSATGLPGAMGLPGGALTTVPSTATTLAGAGIRAIPGIINSGGKVDAIDLLSKLVGAQFDIPGASSAVSLLGNLYKQQQAGK